MENDAYRAGVGSAMDPRPAHLSGASPDPLARPAPCSGCRSMAGRWTPNATSLNEVGGDVLLGDGGESLAQN